MKLIEWRTYDPDDERMNGDAWNVTLLADGVGVLTGDYYHDKIDEQIEGFERALKFLKIDYTKKVRSRHDDGEFVTDRWFRE